jgi:ferrochelatase
VHVVPPWFEDEGYLGAVVARVRQTLGRLAAPPEHVLFTFHGLPLSMVEKGDPYRVHCAATAEALARRLSLEPARWTLTFQSRFGRGRWLAPSTEERLRELAGQGVRRVLLVAPGFVSDCLETLDELGTEAVDAYRQAGGAALSLVPCLNDSPEWIAALAGLVRREASAWARG